MKLSFLKPQKLLSFLSRSSDQANRKRAIDGILADKKTVRLFGKAGHRGTNLSIEPYGSRVVVFEYVPEGDYKLSITHSDKMIHGNRKVLTAKLITSLLEPSDMVAKEMGLLVSDNGEPFLYVGGGRWSKGQSKQFANISIVSEREWIAVSLASSLDRYINIDNIRFGPDIINMRRLQHDISPYVAKMLEKRQYLLEADFILYADINLNVVDGSSVWLSSMLSALASVGKTIVLSKQNIHSDVIWSNVKNRENILTLSPRDFSADDQVISPEVAIGLIRELDNLLPKVRRVIVRGLGAAELLSQTRQFRDRSTIYLTDFYEIEDGKLNVSEKAAKAVRTVVSQAGYLLAQTSVIGEKIAEVSGTQIGCHNFPPPIPDTLPVIAPGKLGNGPVKVGYAGKITPLWGVDQMLDWTSELAETGIESELHIVANRISDGVGKKNVPGFGKSIRSKIERSGSAHYDDFNREASMIKMAQMDYVWCYRPPALEDNTLEVSTKLIEMVGSGAACLCYPSAINRSLLGEDYPFFIESPDDLRRILKSGSRTLPAGLSDKIKQNHSLSNITEQLTRDVLGTSAAPDDAQTIVVCGHDFKFVDPYISHLKAKGHKVLRDTWEWGGPKNIDQSRKLQAQADIVFCEWGLANAVWHSENKRKETKLFIRIHLQEINERARKFGYKINQDAVDGYIFVEEGVRQTAIEMFDIPAEKTHLIANFLLDDEYLDRSPSKHVDGVVRLGMVGIIPQRKRFDLAVELLEKLIDSGQEARLEIKGPRPEQLEFMRAPGRAQELVYYNEVYNRIEASPQLSKAISFEPWGNDVSTWYHKVDFILSPSDFESFHYAVADGVLSGCTPLIWPWEGAGKIYDPEWIVADTDEAFAKVQETLSLTASKRAAITATKRKLLVDRYGYTKIFAQLSKAIGISGGSEAETAKAIYSQVH